MQAEAAPIDRMARWGTPEGVALRAEILDRLARGEGLAPDLDLCGIDLRGAHLRGADLERARLSHARLGGADLTEARLDGADLRGASAAEVVLAGATLAGADLSIGNFWRASFRGAILVGARLDGAVLYAADLSGADLRAASCLGADFKGAWLIGACTEASLSPPVRSPEAYARSAGFPTFAQAASVHSSLLSDPSPTALWIVETCVAFSPSPEAEVLALFRERNWRVQVVAVAAMLVGVTSPAVVERAWELLDRGAWIAPQLAAALLLVDGAFEPEARARLLRALDLPAAPAPAGSAYRLPPQTPLPLSRWKPPKALASLAAAYRRAPNADRNFLDQLEALHHAGQLDADGAVRLTERYLSRVAAGATPAMRARWRWDPA